jgi:serine/threonine-protein kinase RsbW
MREQTQVIELKIPAEPEYLLVARLTLSGIATRMNFGFDEIEDLKIAIAEACTNAIQHAYKNGNHRRIDIKFFIEEDKLRIEVEDMGKGFQPEKIKKLPEDLLEKERGLGIFLIKSLVDEVEFESSKKGTVVKMIKYKR